MSLISRYFKSFEKALIIRALRVWRRQRKSEGEIRKAEREIAKLARAMKG